MGGDVIVGHRAERRLLAGRCGNTAAALSSERVGLVQDLRPQPSVLGAGVGERHLWVWAERHFALATVEPIPEDPVGFAVANGAEIEALRLPIRVASGFLSRPLRTGGVNLGMVWLASFLSVFFPHF